MKKFALFLSIIAISVCAMSGCSNETTDMDSESDKVEIVETDDIQDEVESFQEYVDASKEAFEEESTESADEDTSDTVADNVSDNTSNNPENHSSYQTPSEEYTCPQCWKVVNHLTYGGICEECYEASTNIGSFGYCSYCGDALSEAEVNDYSSDRCWNCKNICCYCGGWVEVDQIIDYGHAICGNCYMMYEMPCENCGAVGNLSWSGDGRILCPNCIAALGQ